MAIDVAGHLHDWNNVNHTLVATAVPDGVYDAISAATSHATAIAGPAPASLCSANAWLGLKNSDDVGTMFDLLAEVSSNGVLLGSGQLAGVPGGSSGFNNAVLRTIALSLSQPSTLPSGDVLSLRLSVRIAQDVPGHQSGTAAPVVQRCCCEQQRRRHERRDPGSLLSGRQHDPATLP